MSVPGTVAHNFNPSTREAEATKSLSFRIARAIQRNPLCKNKNKQKNFLCGETRHSGSRL